MAMMSQSYLQWSQGDMKNKAWRNNVAEEGDRAELLKYLIEAWTKVDELEEELQTIAALSMAKDWDRRVPEEGLDD